MPPSPIQSFIDYAFIHSNSKCLSDTFCGCALHATHSGIQRSPALPFKNLSHYTLPTLPPCGRSFSRTTSGAHICLLFGKSSAALNSTISLLSFKEYYTPYLHNQLYCGYEFPLSYSFFLPCIHTQYIYIYAQLFFLQSCF